MPTFKTFGSAGAWINGRWQPDGANAAMTGTALPDPAVEKARAEAAAVAADDAKLATDTAELVAEEDAAVAAKLKVRAEAKAAVAAAKAAANK